MCTRQWKSHERSALRRILSSSEMIVANLGLNSRSMWCFDNSILWEWMTIWLLRMTMKTTEYPIPYVLEAVQLWTLAFSLSNSGRQSVWESFLFRRGSPRYLMESVLKDIPRIFARVVFLSWVTSETKISHFWRLGFKRESPLKVSSVSFVVSMDGISVLDKMKRSYGKAKYLSFVGSHLGWKVNGWFWMFALRSWVRPSITRMKSEGDKGSPWRRPREALNFPTREPLRLTEKDAVKIQR